MKKFLSLILTFIMMLSLFGGVSVLAEDTFPIGSLYFTLDNYSYGLPVDGIKIVEPVYDYLFDKYEAYIADEAGLEAVGNLEAETEYYLCIKFTLNKMVDISSVSSKTVFLSGWGMNDISPYKFRGLNGSYLITFKLPVLAKGFEQIDFKIEGYGVGNHTDDIKVTTDTENIEIDRIGWSIRTLDDTVYSAAQGKIKNGVNYILRIYINVPEGYSPVGLSREYITLSGLPSGDLNSGGCIDGDSFNGIATSVSGKDTKFSIPFLIPAGGEELIALNGINFNVSGNNENNKVSDLKVSTANKDIEIRYFQPYEYTEDSLTGIRGMFDRDVFAPMGKYFMIIDAKIPDEYYIDTSDLSGFTLLGKPAEKCERSVGIRVQDGYNVYRFTFDLPLLKKGEVYEEEIVADVDGDGVVTVSDALSVLRIASGISEAEATYTQKAVTSPVKGDVDGDGALTVADALVILRIAAGL